jgi:hypothetical protein
MLNFNAKLGEAKKEGASQNKSRILIENNLKGKSRLKRFASQMQLDTGFLHSKELRKEDSKDDEIKEQATNDSTPHKSMAESDEEVFDSFCLPEAEGFQLEFRKKLSDRTVSDHDAIRTRFLNKLTQQKVWLLPSQKPKSHQSCIIFDWDDTLLCTTFLNPNGYATNDPVPNSFIGFLLKLEKVVIEILTESLKHGKVFIITNAAEGWVEFSSKKYMPKVYKLLPKISVVSARSKYE